MRVVAIPNRRYPPDAGALDLVDVVVASLEEVGSDTLPAFGDD
jgi:hypothetical protein